METSNSSKRIEKLKELADAARQKYEEAQQKFEVAFPGSFAAGPARYPVARHEKAHARLYKLLDAAKQAQRRYEAAVTNAENKALIQEEASAMLALKGEQWVDKIEVGDLFRFTYTSCYVVFEAIGRALRINARTIQMEVVKSTRERRVDSEIWQVSLHGAEGRRWAVPKVPRGDNRIIEIVDPEDLEELESD